MTYAKGYYDSMYGRIESSWSVKDGIFRYTFTIPCNTTALLYLPAASAKDVRENGKEIKKSVGITFAGEKDGNILLNLQSGNYSFEVKR